jgi:hypothetical protein
MTDDEKFFAWLDGELGPVEAAEMDARVAADPQLARKAEQHDALGAQLRGAFESVAEAPVPERLHSQLRAGAEVIDFAEAKRSRFTAPLLQWAAMAASLVFGVFIGTLTPRHSGNPVAIEGGRLYAASTLNHALDTELASAPAGDVRIGLTFRDRAGEICRSFTGTAGTGLACRDGSRWQLRGLFATPEGQRSVYRMAAGMDPNLATLVGSMIVGDPFDAATERAALKRHWR